MELLAKSNPPQTLKEHIDNALKIEKILENSFSSIEKISYTDNFWNLLKVCIILHDLGKAHKEFQKLLLENNNAWKHQRHELFSLPFVKGLNYSEKEFIYFVIAGHHKDFETLLSNLENYGPEDDDFGLNLLGTENICTFESEFTNNMPIEILLELINGYGIKLKAPIIHNPKKYLQQFIKNKFKNKNEQIRLLLLAGAFKQCDHLSSAGIKTIFNLNIKDFRYLYESDYSFYQHQKKACSLTGNAILTAPTGSGKTETSLLWLQHQIKIRGNGRVFYILPFTASINAMYERLEKHLPNKVGLLHGKLAAFIEAKFEDDDLVDEKRKKEIKEQYKTLVTPLKIVTPFQLLKNIFALKGFEKGLFEWVGGYFIFDEIHAYNPKVFAQIISLIKFSIKYLGVKVFLMTATLPFYLRKEIENSIGHYTSINATTELYNQFVRHKVIVRKGLISDNFNLIQKYLDNGKKVLVVCNTVKQAQAVFARLNSKSKLLLHSAFNANDRNRKEKQLFENDIELLVGTQVIEVSLDIDYDVIFTEQAPLDALIQRFGRVNRKREKGICECFVFDQRNDLDKFIYKNKGVISRTMQILKEKEITNSGIILESELQQMINFVYPDWDKDEKEEFDKITSLIDNFVENEMKPFIYNEKQEDDFYEQFDGIKVLPSTFLKEYQNLLDENKFIKAENLKVKISSKRFKVLIQNEEIYVHTKSFESIKTQKLLEQKVFVINKKYDEKIGLQFDINENNSSEDCFL